MTETDAALAGTQTVTGAEWLVLVALLIFGLAIVVYTIRTGVPPMPTSPGTRAALLRLLPGRIDGPIYELGSGWGGLAYAVARRYPDNEVIGIELSPIPWLYSQLWTRIRRRSNLRFRRTDFLGEPLADAGAVICYLMPSAVRRLGRKLGTELRPGTVVLSYTFAFDDWPPDAVVVEAESGPSPIYRYVVS